MRKLMGEEGNPCHSKVSNTRNQAATQSVIAKVNEKRFVIPLTVACVDSPFTPPNQAIPTPRP